MFKLVYISPEGDTFTIMATEEGATISPPVAGVGFVVSDNPCWPDEYHKASEHLKDALELLGIGSVGDWVDTEANWIPA